MRCGARYVAQARSATSGRGLVSRRAHIDEGEDFRVGGGGQATMCGRNIERIYGKLERDECAGIHRLRTGGRSLARRERACVQRASARAKLPRAGPIGRENRRSHPQRAGAAAAGARWQKEGGSRATTCAHIPDEHIRTGRHNLVRGEPLYTEEAGLVGAAELPLTHAAPVEHTQLRALGAVGEAVSIRREANAKHSCSRAHRLAPAGPQLG
eukprot:scaffold49553_cov30-Tisochrysis_lutea.AAC.3